MSERIIMLVDMNAFFISCEIARRPELAPYPAAVAGDPRRRAGVVLAPNYKARAFGVRTAMTLHEALRLCPQLRTVPPDKDYYSRVSRRVFAILRSYTPLVEPNSIDEGWLDMTDVLSRREDPDPVEAARTIMAHIAREEKLGCSIGIAPNKYLAKMAADMKKPHGITRLGYEDVPERLWPLAVEKLHGVGPRSAERLHALGIRTVGDLIPLGEAYLTEVFGRAGASMWAHAHGRGSDQVHIPDADDMKSISREITLGSDLRSPAEVNRRLKPLADDVAARAKRHHKLGRTVQVTLRLADTLKRITRQRTVSPTDDAEVIHRVGSELISHLWTPDTAARLIGIGLTGFEPEGEAQGPEQLDLSDWLKVGTPASWDSDRPEVKPTEDARADTHREKKDGDREKTDDQRGKADAHRKEHDDEAALTARGSAESSTASATDAVAPATVTPGAVTAGTADPDTANPNTADPDASAPDTTNPDTADHAVMAHTQAMPRARRPVNIEALRKKLGIADLRRASDLKPYPKKGNPHDAR